MIDLGDRKLSISNVKIVKRTFEGKMDKSKNDNPITSEYMTSYKYAVIYSIADYEHNPVIHCQKGKKDAEQFVLKLKKVHNVI